MGMTKAEYDQFQKFKKMFERRDPNSFALAESVEPAWAKLTEVVRMYYTLEAMMADKTSIDTVNARQSGALWLDLRYWTFQLLVIKINALAYDGNTDFLSLNSEFMKRHRNAIESDHLAKCNDHHLSSEITLWIDNAILQAEIADAQLATFKTEIIRLRNQQFAHFTMDRETTNLMMRDMEAIFAGVLSRYISLAMYFNLASWESLDDSMTYKKQYAKYFKQLLQVDETQ